MTFADMLPLRPVEFPNADSLTVEPDFWQVNILHHGCEVKFYKRNKEAAVLAGRSTRR
jgi:hypothetical protein